MDPFWKTLLVQEFGGAIQMLENAIQACPEAVWSDDSKAPAWTDNDVPGFWYVVYHTLYFLDYYSSPNHAAFHPPAPFNLDELDPAGILPATPYTKDELGQYLNYCRARCLAAIEELSEENAREHCGWERFAMSRAELVIHSLRHVQHHAGQLHLLLRQRTASAPRWVSQASLRCR